MRQPTLRLLGDVNNLFEWDLNVLDLVGCALSSSKLDVLKAGKIVSLEARL